MVQSVGLHAPCSSPRRSGACPRGARVETTGWPDNSLRPVHRPSGSFQSTCVKSPPERIFAVRRTRCAKGPGILPGSVAGVRTSHGWPRSPPRQTHLYPHFLFRNKPIVVATLKNPQRGVLRFNQVRVLQLSLSIRREMGLAHLGNRKLLISLPNPIHKPKEQQTASRTHEEMKGPSRFRKNHV